MRYGSETSDDGSEAVEAVAVTFYRHTDGCERKPDVHVRVQVCGWVG